MGKRKRRKRRKRQTLTESLEIDGRLIVDYVQSLQTAKDSADAMRQLDKIESMTKAIRWYVVRATAPQGETDG